MNEADRFLLIYKQSGLSQTDFGKSLGLSKYQVSHILCGRTKPSRNVLNKLNLEYRATLNWFFSGQGCLQESQEIASVELIKQEAAAGRGIQIENYAKANTIPVPYAIIHPHKPSGLKAVYVSSDSMTGERIYDGDIVIFCLHLTSGDAVYVVSVGDSLLVKRFSFDRIKNTITLISANSYYPPRVLSGEELECVKIGRRVKACLHRM